MEDLAESVIKHLSVTDGPGPFALTYTHLNRHTARTERWLVLAAERVNSRVVYQVSIAAASVYHPQWRVITYESAKAAAAFAFAFLEAPHFTCNPKTNLERAVCHQLELREIAVEWKGAENTRCFSDCFSYKYGTFGVTSLPDLQAAMLTLMPVSQQRK